MANALLTGVSGLIAHQRMLDVVGNNLANLNTAGYKAQRTLFADLLYTTINPATGATDNVAGGRNPNQIGSGVKVAQIGRLFTQGTLEQTGRDLDFALQGDGFFIVNDGQRNLYTRSGAFSLDDMSYLVDPTTGGRVLRYGSAGEPDGVNPSFQTPGDDSIFIPLGASIPGTASTSLTLMGNLSSYATGPAAEVLTSTAPFMVGGAAAAAGDLLNDLDSLVAAYGAGDALDITGTAADGSAVSVTVSVDGTTTLGDLIAAVSGAYPDATASLDASGNLVLTADADGEASLTLRIDDASTNTGGANWNSHSPVVTTSGKVGDIVNSTIEVYDVRGGSHTVHLAFQKQSDNIWDMTASVDAADGVLTDDSVLQIQFNDDGSFDQVLGTGVGDANLAFQWNGITAPQTVDVLSGSNGGFDGLTQLATSSGVLFDQDGFGAGVITSVQVNSDGMIEAVATNGRRFIVAQLAIASFRNPGGLIALGDNYYVESLNSGEVQIGTALSGTRGAVAPGHLESSNVEIAFEFTRLIVAQRGFSANARTITVADEMLEELTNVIR
jgi:flagellar hook protein FlgE